MISFGFPQFFSSCSRGTDRLVVGIFLPQDSWQVFGR